MDLLSTLRRDVDTSSSWGTQEFTTWQDEQLSWKTTAYLGDWSWLDEFRISGPDALRFLSDHAINSFAKFDIGQAKHAVFCNSEGKVIGEGVLLRLADDDFEFQSRGPVVLWLEHRLKHGEYQAASAVSISKFKLQVSGPLALGVLEDASRTSLRDIRFMRFAEIEVAGVPVSFLRQGMAGEVGFELQGPGDRAEAVKQAILQAGEKHGIRRLGSRTAMINHLEAAFPTITHDYIPAVGGANERAFLEENAHRVPTYGSAEWFRSFARTVKVKGSFEGSELSDWYRSPIELGWAKSIKLDHDFYGREALEKELHDPRRKLVSLVWDKNDVIDVYASLFEDEEPYQYMEMPRHSWNAMFASSTMSDGKLVGVATSRGYSFYFRKMLSHCVIDVEKAQPGTEVEVIWGDPGTRQKMIRATVAPSPYKQDRRREDLTAISEVSAEK